ncbi:wax ester synthase/diacylglycerol acyltransferase 4-like [Vicia villosa]|uniref:wax ester synthase/diacylglycerol acyltransferase 4-like n=1 Tax=Vicia villosa TaxID=3911 RepID=UPI00273CD0EF|nr:wax ester synthase/diacylglycerol acyltransferase 4-like [Vicia villosa]
MDKFYEEVEEPVSPHGQYFNTSVICSYIFGFLELAIPSDVSLAIPLINNVFLPINPRFSSIMVRHENGTMRWRKVEVKPEEHIKIPKFPETTNSSPIELYDSCLSDYVTSILIERTPEDKPLWEIHIINYPTTNAASTIIFKLHHSLGDGYSLMAALLSCLQRADDPSLPLTFPSRSQLDSKHTKKGLFKNLCFGVNAFFSSISDFGSSIIKTRMIPDDITPIRSGYKGFDSRPTILSNISFSLDQIKEIKSNLGVTINDVVCGIIFYGIRLYMEEMNEKTKRANSTAIVMLNTRNIKGYQSLKEMQKPESKGLWGNKISFLQIPIPKPNKSGISNPLEFVWKARKIIKRKKSSFSVHLIGLLMDLEMKLRGPEAVSKIIFDTLGNTSVVISNIVGPVEKMTLANHPVNGLYFNMTGGPQDINIAIMSYVKVLRVSMKTLKGFIDEQKLKFCMEKAFEVIFKASMKISEISTKDYLAHTKDCFKN